MDLRAHRTQAHAVASRLPDTSIRYDVFSDTCFIFNKNIFTHPTISSHLTLGLFYIQIIQTRISLEYKPFLHSSHIDLNTHFPFFSPSITNRNFHHPFFCSIDTSYTFQHTTSIESPTFHKTTSHFPTPTILYHTPPHTTTHAHTSTHLSFLMGHLRFNCISRRFTLQYFASFLPHGGGSFMYSKRDLVTSFAVQVPL